MPKIGRADVAGFMLTAAAGTDRTHRTAVVNADTELVRDCLAAAKKR